MTERSDADDAICYRVSSFSGANGACVAVHQLSSGDVIVKHSRSAEPRLTFTETEWSAFLRGVKAGEFDDLRPG